MGNKKNAVANLIGTVSFAISIVVMVLIFMQTGSEDIWYDEVFSVAFIKGSLSDVIRSTAMDVHPPLYYIYLKIIVSICPFSFISACKVASAIPLIGMLLIAFFWVRKRYGLCQAGIFAILISLMPQLQTYYVEIRMYSFAMLLVTCAGCCLVDIISEAEPHISKWILFFISSIAVAYTQYFACVAVIALYVILFLVCIIRKDKNAVKLTFIMAGGSVLLYLPWLPVFYKQVTNVTGSYWILPMTLRSIPGCLKFIFLPVSGEGKITYAVAGLMILVVAAIYGLFVFGKKKNMITVAGAFMGIAAIIFMIVIGFAASLLGSPIFTYRYMIPALGLLYLGIIIALNSIDNMALIVVLCVACLLEGFYGVKNFVWEEQMKADAFENAKLALSEVKDGSIIITNFDHVATIASYYFPESNVYVYEGETDPLVGKLFHGNGTWVTNEAVKELVANNDNVVFLGSFVSRDEIVEDWRKIGIDSTYEGECLVERYWFNIYTLGLSNE